VSDLDVDESLVEAKRTPQLEDQVIHCQVSSHDLVANKQQFSPYMEADRTEVCSIWHQLVLSRTNEYR
jgi:hypothetical protein